MKYNRKEDKYRISYDLIQDRENEKFNRMAIYNNILFINMENILSKKKALTILNEKKSGGMIISKSKNIDKVFENFKKQNKNLSFFNIRKMENYSKISRITFSSKIK